MIAAPWLYHAAHWTLLAVAIGLLVLALFTPWRKPGGIPHREHVGLCSVGVGALSILLSETGRPADDGVYFELAFLTAIFLIFAVRSFRARRAEVALEPAETPAATTVGGGA